MAKYSLVFLVLLSLIFAFMPVANTQSTIDSGQTDAPSSMTQQAAEIQNVLDHWDDAVDQHDAYALELILAPQFINISDNGLVTDRDQKVADFVMKKGPHFILVQKVVSMHMLDDVAVVNGTYDRVYKASTLNHTPLIDQKGVFTQIYIRARSSWQCINSQRTLIVENAVDEKKSKKKKRSTTRP
jgi:hypothetical protein